MSTPDIPRNHWSRLNPRVPGWVTFFIFLVGTGLCVSIYRDQITPVDNTDFIDVFQLNDVGLSDPLTPPFNFSDLTISREAILSGGPPRDGIPSITTLHAKSQAERDIFAEQSPSQATAYYGSQPPVIRAVQSDDLLSSDRVVWVEHGGEQRAYPIAVLNWHECINDVLGGKPIAVTYCPLCDSVTVVHRQLQPGGPVYEFGISGLLYNSNVLLYDRTDFALWSQAGLAAVSGPHAGQALHHLDQWGIGSLGQFAERYPQGSVLTTTTGFTRRYTGNPYASYFSHDRLMFPVSVEDDRLPRKTPIIGVRIDDWVMAYPLEQVREAAAPNQMYIHNFDQGVIELRVTEEVVAGFPAVDIVQVPEGVHVIHTFWYAWAAFHPETEVFNSN